MASSLRFESDSTFGRIYAKIIYGEFLDLAMVAGATSQISITES